MLSASLLSGKGFLNATDSQALSKADEQDIGQWRGATLPKHCQ
jgi:hypothetical protein